MRRLLVIMMLLVAMAAHAQFYTTGDDPMRIRWQQIENDRYRIIFDREMTPWATRLANMMDCIVRPDASSLGHTPQPIDILIHSHIAYSNGLVSWAPRRLEMYSFGQADGDCVSWMTHLAIHEYRHVVQTSMLKRGFTRFLYGLFGEQAIGAALGAYVPLWLMEGDAVANETALTHGGRGRQSLFEQEMRAPVICGKTPTYDQAYNGSYRRYVADYYHMGYLTVSNVRTKYGTHVWRNALESVGSMSFSFTPFNRSLRHDTGLDKVGLYDEAMADWQSRWTKQDSSIVTTPFDVVLCSANDYTEFTSARMTSNGLVAFKTSLDDLPQIVGHDGKQITTPATRSEHEISSHADTIVWCERKPHPRWDNAGTNVIMMIRTDGTGKRAIARGMFSTPSISPDGCRIATAETLVDGRQQIVVIDFNGTTLATHEIDPWTQATSICWWGDTIAYISLSDRGKDIVSIDPDGTKSVLLEPSFANIRHLTSDGIAIYFTSDASGIENIYCRGDNGTIERMTSSRFGAAWPMVCRDTLFYSEYTDRGYVIASTLLSTRATDSPLTPMHDMANCLSDLESQSTQLVADSASMSIKPYGRLRHLFNIHSWGPVVVNAEDNTVSAGLALSSQNTLGNSTLSAGIDWGKDTDERAFARYSYTGFLPKIDVSATWGYHDHKLDAVKTITEEKTENHYRFEGIRCFYDSRQNTQRYRARIYLPLNFYSGAWIGSLRPLVATDFNHRNAIDTYRQHLAMDDGQRVLGEIEKYESFRENYGTLNYELHAQLLRRTAYRDIGCRMGFALGIGYRHSAFFQDYGSMTYGSATLYLPGFARHHNISLQASYQDKRLGDIRERPWGDVYYPLLGDAIGIARGTSRLRNKRMSLARINYTMPLICPDWSLGPVCYIKRINGRLFFDYEKVDVAPYTLETDTRTVTFKSVGIETWMESHWLRLPYLIRLGYRACIVNSKDFSGEMIFGINIK